MGDAFENHQSTKSILKSKTHVSGNSNDNMRASAKGLLDKQSSMRMKGCIGNLMPGMLQNGPHSHDKAKATDESEVSPKTIEVVFKTPKELEEEENERKAKEAFKTLARILKEAKEEKHRLLNEQIENVEDNYNQPIKVVPEEFKPWTIYPDGKFSTLWDLFITL